MIRHIPTSPTICTLLCTFLPFTMSRVRNMGLSVAAMWGLLYLFANAVLYWIIFGSDDNIVPREPFYYQQSPINRLYGTTQRDKRGHITSIDHYLAAVFYVINALLHKWWCAYVLYPSFDIEYVNTFVHPEMPYVNPLLSRAQRYFTPVDLVLPVSIFTLPLLMPPAPRLSATEDEHMVYQWLQYVTVLLYSLAMVTVLTWVHAKSIVYLSLIHI